MANRYVTQRLVGIHNVLRAVHQAGVAMSSASKGAERAAFVHEFLAKAMPEPYRFGAGDVTDATGERSGQVDVVVEYPFSPSLPLAHSVTSRLYLAEGVAAVVEVKSDVADQWGEAVGTANKVHALSRQFGATHTMGQGLRPLEKIPVFVAGYTGWKTLETAKKHLDESPSVAGVLVIDPGIFVARPEYSTAAVEGGAFALWCLVTTLYGAVSTLQSATTTPLRYIE